jgi:hypothetical protein
MEEKIVCKEELEKIKENKEGGGWANKGSKGTWEGSKAGNKALA